MSKKYRNRGIAFVVLVAVSLILFLLDKKKQETLKNTENESKLWDVDDSKIKGISLTAASSEIIKFERGQTEWKITSPRKLDVDHSAISAWLRSFINLSSEEVINSKPSSIDEYGLNPPTDIIEVELKNDLGNLTLSLGAETPTGSNFYAQTNTSSQILKLSFQQKSSLIKPLFDFRDRRILQFNKSKITKLQILNGSNPIEFFKNINKEWQLNLPPPVRTDESAIEGLVASLDNGQMQSVVKEVPGNLAKYGLSRPNLRIRTIEEKRKSELWIGKKTNESHYFAMEKGKGPIFTVFDSLVNQFKKPSVDFRNNKLFDFQTFNIQIIEIKTPDRQIKLEKQDSSWESITGEKVKPDQDKISKFLTDLSGIQIENFVTDQPVSLSRYGLSSPSVSIKINWGQDQQEIISFGESKKIPFAKRRDSKTIFKISLSTYEEIKNNIEEL